MIFFYQVRTLTQKTVACTDVTCPLCGHTGGVQLSIHQKYTWLLGPLAPAGKYGLAYCSHCNQQIPAMKWNRQLEQAYQTEKRTVTTPLRLWRGMIVIPVVLVLFVAGGSLLLSQKKRSQQQRASTIKEYAANPQPGDLYQIIVPGKNGGTWYSYAKYVRTQGDTVFVVLLNKLGPANTQWAGLDTESAGAFDVHEVPVVRSMLEKDLLISVAGHPNMTMTIWAMKRNGELINKY